MESMQGCHESVVRHRAGSCAGVGGFNYYYYSMCPPRVSPSGARHPYPTGPAQRRQILSASCALPTPRHRPVAKEGSKQRRAEAPTKHHAREPVSSVNAAVVTNLAGEAPREPEHKGAQEMGAQAAGVPQRQNGASSLVPSCHTHPTTSGPPPHPPTRQLTRQLTDGLIPFKSPVSTRLSPSR